MTNIDYQCWSWWIRVLAVVCTWPATDGLFHVVAPAFYVAFSGDLVINYTIPTNVSLPNAFIRLVSINLDTPQEITTLGIPLGHHSGSLKISCGVVEFPGSYRFQMRMHAGGPVLTQTTLDVRWPTVAMFLPDSFIAQTQDAILRISSQATCPSLLHRYSFHLDLEYRQEDEISLHPGKPEVIYSEPYTDISSKTRNWKFPCNLFNVPGTYRAVLRSTYNTFSVVSRSHPMKTKWSEAYKITLLSSTVFPCVGSLPVYYTHPSCSGRNDKIRMYLLRRQVSGSLAAPVERRYVMERHADPDKTNVVFSCELFNTTAVGYCFVYVTVTSKGAVREQHRACISAHPDSVIPIDGGWSNWSPWGECTASCGNGKLSRFRMCTNPSPSHGGQFCQGDTVEWKPCYKECTDNIPLTPLHSPQINATCACSVEPGCKLNQPSGEIIATGRCQGLSIWRLTVKPDQCIKLTFLYFDLYEDKQWVKIRNGDSLSADLLAFSSGGNEITDIISSTNTMLIEFMTESSKTPASFSDSSTLLPALLYPRKPTRRIHVHGFIATYSAHDNNMTTALVSASPIRITENGTIWQSTVTLLGIGLCVLIVIAALAFVIYNRMVHKRKHKYGMAPQDDSPTHVARSASNHSSPVHGIEIEHDMEAPLTGDTSKKKEMKESTGEGTKSRGNSISSNCSNGLRKFKKGETQGGGSPRPSPRAYTPLATSPEEKGPSDEITVENSSLFKVSPLLAARKPKSPKIHPSPKLNRTSKPSTPVSPTETKEDMLKKKRHKKDKKDDVRIVTGAAAAPPAPKGRVTFAAASPGTITLKADITSPERPNISKKEKRKKLTGKSKDHSDKEKEQNPKEKDHEKKDLVQIQLRDVEKCETEVMRNPGSGTSDESSSACPVKNENEGIQQTTSFIQEVPQGAKPRRPTSLTESYSKQIIVPTETPSDNLENKELTASADRQSALPKPDGQSPKNSRQESTKSSKSSTPRSIRSGRSNKTMSPSRSIHTPSDIASEGLELEYDDFIDYDDTFSYFDPIETEKLTWHGIVEKLEKQPKENSD